MKKGFWFIPALSVVVLIFDAKTALQGATEGVELCLKTVIPSLFPFFFLTSWLCKQLTGRNFKVLRPLGRICRISKGKEPLLLMGWLGGYPIGAVSIADAYKNGAVSKNEANRMLGFCNNPGPAFLFGISASIWDSPLIPLSVYIMVILSSVLTGFILPGGSDESRSVTNHASSSPLTHTLHASANVCGWVILFRILLTFMNHWFLWLLPEEMGIVISGMTELTNGCIALKYIQNPLVQYILFTFFLTFGGLCVGMQTLSATKELNIQYFVVGKGIQTLLALALSLAVGVFLFPGNIPIFYGIAPLFILLSLYLLWHLKNNTGNCLLYGV